MVWKRVRMCVCRGGGKGVMEMRKGKGHGESQ
jgi:hypothetical protein